MGSCLPCSVAVGATFVGPALAAVGDTKKREQYLHRLSETISITDEVFGLVIKTNHPQETAELRDSAQFISNYRPMIEDHVERRIAILFQQLVAVYATKLHFEIGDTLHQGESATALYIVDHNDKRSKLCVRNAAHSSTLPCLIAYEGIAWKKHVDEGTAQPDGFIYIKEGDIYRGANSTLAMPREINEADIEVDGKRGDSGLRAQTLGILNEAAAGLVDPEEGLKRFIQIFEDKTRVKIKSAKKAGVKEALHIYKDTIEAIKGRINVDSLIFDRMLGVRIDQKNSSAGARKKIYQLRYKAIRDCQYAQSEMIDKINIVSGEVLAKISPNRSPDYFKEAFRQVLREQMASDIDRCRLDKLFNNPQDGYFRELAQRRSRLAKTKELVRKELVQIQHLARTLRVDFRALKFAEIRNRGKITFELRSMLNWSQRKLSQEIQKLFPHTAASQSTISRIENHVKLIDRQYAQELAQVFKVDPGLFIPAFYYD